MNHEPPFPTDDAIERGLARRAPHGADARLLDAVMAEVGGAPQAWRWAPSLDVPVMRLRRRSVWFAIAAALAALLAAMALLGVGRSHPPLPALIPLPSAAATPARTEDSPLPMACYTDAIVATAVPSGKPVADYVKVLADFVQLPGLGGGRIAYLTDFDDGTDNGRGIDVWVASGEPAIPSVVATFRGPLINVASVAPWSRSSGSLLVTIGQVGASNLPDCEDLYLIEADGSSVRRLTHNGAQTDVYGRLSPAGGKVAYVTALGRTSLSLDVVGADGTLAREWTDACFESWLLRTPMWSPDGSRIAIPCSQRVEIYDPVTGARTSVEQPGGPAGAIGWSADGRRLFAATFAETVNGTLTVASINPVQRSWTPEVRFDGASIPWPPPEPGEAFAPDVGHMVDGSWILDLATAKLDELLPRQAAVTTWAPDSSSVVYLTDLGGQATLRRQPLDGGPSSVIGILPTLASSSSLYSGTSVAVEIP
jgi:hypothetical protein